MKTLKESYEELQDLIEDGTIDLNDFYTISFGRFDIRALGNYSTFLIAKYQRKFGDRFQLEENGFAELTINNNVTLIFG